MSPCPPFVNLAFGHVLIVSSATRFRQTERETSFSFSFGFAFISRVLHCVFWWVITSVNISDIVDWCGSAWPRRSVLCSVPWWFSFWPILFNSFTNETCATRCFRVFECVGRMKRKEMSTTQQLMPTCKVRKQRKYYRRHHVVLAFFLFSLLLLRLFLSAFKRQTEVR